VAVFAPLLSLPGEFGAFAELVRKAAVRAQLVAVCSFPKSHTERFSNFRVKVSHSIDFARRDLQQLANGQCDYVPGPHGFLEYTLGPEKSFVGKVNVFLFRVIRGTLREELAFDHEEHGARDLPTADDVLSALCVDHVYLAAEVP
jgi:hypothetical protein